MSQSGRYRVWLTLGIVAALALAGALLTLKPTTRTPPPQPDESGHGAAPRKVEICTNPGATTPQIPLWAALRQPQVQEQLQPDITVWKTAAHLQSLLLAGEGDIWVGHLDGFARARARGAPVTLLAVTGWRKFALISRDPEVTNFQQFNGRQLAYAPTGCPSVDILTAVLGDNISRIEFVPHEPKQLALKMMQGKIDSALLPEPLITVLLDKADDLRVVANVEDVYARLNQGQPRMPIAGIAVHSGLVHDDPHAVALLQETILAQADKLADTPAEAVAVLPEEFGEFVPGRIVRASLQRDIILAKGAADVATEIRNYLRIVTPELFESGSGLPDDFFSAAPDDVGE